MRRPGERARVGSASGAPEPPFATPSLPPALPPPSLAWAPAFVLSSLGRPAGSAVERSEGCAGGGSRAVGPRGLETPRRLPSRGAAPEPGRAGACAAAAGDLAAALAARSPSASLRRGLGSRPARGAEGSERRSRFGIGGSRGNNSCLSFEEIFLVGKSLFLRVWMQRAVPRVCGRRELRWTPNWSGRVSPHPHGRVLFVSLIFHFPSSNLLDLFNFSFSIN